MKKHIAFIAIVAIMAVAYAVGQAAAPAPTPTPGGTPASCSQTAIAAGTADSNCAVHFVTESAFYALTNGKQATMVGVRAPLMPRWSVFASVFLIPGAQGNITVVGPEFREKLGHIFKGAAGKSLVNLNKFQVFGRLGLGSEYNSLNAQRAFAYHVEGGVGFPVATVATGKVLELTLRIGYLGVPHPGGVPERFALNSNVAASPGLNLNF